VVILPNDIQTKHPKLNFLKLHQNTKTIIIPVFSISGLKLLFSFFNIKILNSNEIKIFTASSCSCNCPVRDPWNISNLNPLPSADPSIRLSSLFYQLRWVHIGIQSPRAAPDLEVIRTRENQLRDLSQVLPFSATPISCYLSVRLRTTDHLWGGSHSLENWWLGQ